MKIFISSLCLLLLVEGVFNMTKKLKRDILFTGKIEAIDLGCWTDGLCVMEVSGKDIVFGSGYSGSDWGEVIGIDLQKSSDYIGKNVEVFCHRLIISYTLEGNIKYYIKLLDETPQIAPDKNTKAHPVE